MSACSSSRTSQNCPSASWDACCGVFVRETSVPGPPRLILDHSPRPCLNFDRSHRHLVLHLIVAAELALQIVFAAQILFVFNFFYSIFKGRKVTSLNPWGATTLEWTTPLRPGHGNWPGEIPEVHRWAYDYGKDGRDFIPQTEPVSPNETKEH